MYDGADCVMLSGETAVGKFPLESIQMQQMVINVVETSEEYQLMLKAHATEFHATSLPAPEAPISFHKDDGSGAPFRSSWDLGGERNDSISGRKHKDSLKGINDRGHKGDEALAITEAARTIAERLRAKAIGVITTSGKREEENSVMK